jgi:ABC-type nitrate/sulfonate/bicarbonate transport system permease component
MSNVRAMFRPFGYGLAGVLVVLVVWQLIAATKVLGGVLSAPTVVARVLGDDDQRSVLMTAVVATGGEAVEGFLWGLAAAIGLGVLVTVVRPLRAGMDQLATIESAVPFVALAPIMIAVFSREHVPSAIAAATAFFPLYVAVVAGMDAITPAVADLFTVFGATGVARLLRARVPAGLPVMATGLKVGMPLAIVGAVIGEWFGARQGIGPVMLAAMRSYRMPTMWAAVVLTVGLALMLYGMCSLIERFAAVRFG